MEFEKKYTKLRNIGLDENEINEIIHLSGCQKLLKCIEELEKSQNKSSEPFSESHLAGNSVGLDKKKIKKKKMTLSFSSAYLERKKNEIKIDEKLTVDDSTLRTIETEDLNFEINTRTKNLQNHDFNTLIELSKIAIEITDSEHKELAIIQSVCKTFISQKGYDLGIIKSRRAVVKELYETEINFCEKMKQLNSHFRIPMMQLKDNGSISQTSFENVFLTLEDLIICSKTFIEKLKFTVEHFSYNTCLGNLLEDLLANAWPYIRFSIDYNIVQSELKLIKTNLFVQKLLKEKSNEPSLDNQTIESLLIQPVQRIMRYPILLKQMLKFTPKSHCDYKLLSEANTDYTFFIHGINERAKLRDKLVGVSQLLNDSSIIQPWRYYLREKKVILNGKHSTVYLLNDMVCFETEKLLIDNKTLVEISDSTTLTIKRTHNIVSLQFDDEKDVRDWKNVISDIIKNNKWKPSNEKAWFYTLCKYKGCWLQK